MDKALYTDRSGLFSFNRLDCLRNEYAKNECALCIEICPSDAFVYEQEKLRLSIGACTHCGACIGGCPSDALSLFGFEIDKVLENITKNENPSLTCKENLPCLAAFGVDEWVSLLLESQKTFTCKLSPCANCEINKDVHISSVIEKRLEEANSIVEAFGEYRILKDFVGVEKMASRRAFFNKFIPSSKEATQEQQSLERVKKAIKPYLPDMTQTKVATPFSLIHQKVIDQSCTNCKECVQFCPTHALSYNGDGTKILFQMGKCIGCGICEDICKPNAIKSIIAPFDWVDFAYDRAKILIEHNLQVCLTCKCAFSYKGGQKVCERCATFEKEHAEMFTLASDIG